MANDHEFFDDVDIESINEEITDNDDNIILAAQAYPTELVIIPLKERPLFPGMIVPVFLQSEIAIESLKAVLESENKLVGFILLKDSEKEGKDLTPEDFYNVGTIARIMKHNINLEESSGQILVQGLDRFEVDQFFQMDPQIIVRMTPYFESEYESNEELKAYALAIVQAIKELMEFNPLFKEEIKLVLNRASLDEPGELADFAASLTTVDKNRIQEVLAEFSVRNRIEKTLQLLREEINISRMKDDINQQIEDKISKRQKEYFLREQLKLIKKELGIQKDDKTELVEKFQERMKELTLSEEAEKIVKSELEKLGYLEPHSPEYGVSRNYIEWILSLPWGIFRKDNFSLDDIQKILDQDHYGLKDLKKSIIEFISVARLKGELKGTILCLVGPPGVGKTSVGKSIARALNRDFFRFSLGGMRDEAEIKGHRRTYIGAMPGKIVQALKNAKSSNPVIMLDEIDKIGMSYQGDPASALLEVLDPEQNSSFLDHYLDVPYDLSKVLFIATANMLDTIPEPLLDRMEILRLSGYIEDEKLAIAQKFLLPKLLEKTGIKKKQVGFGKKAIRYIINHYARESGVRSLDKKLQKILRKIATKIVRSDDLSINYPVKVNAEVESYLGKPIFTDTMFLKKMKPGVVTGLAWTSLGGETLFIESTKIASKHNGFKQTGQLGDVMIESSDIAFTYVRAKAKKFGISASFFRDHLIHLHVPEGATPKDGPSAGITMATALISLALNKRVSIKLAMTGEISLKGLVLPIGGVKEKVIAAKRAKRTTLIMPHENLRDFEELPDFIKKGITVHFVKDYEEVFEIVFKNAKK